MPTPLSSFLLCSISFFRPSLLHIQYLLFFHQLLTLFSRVFFSSLSSTLFSNLPHSLLIVSYPTSFSLLIFHFLCPVLPMWVHWTVMWGAAVLLTKHKAFHIHPAPGIPGYCSVCVRACGHACVRVCVRARVRAFEREKDSGREIKKKSYNRAECLIH